MEVEHTYTYFVSYSHLGGSGNIELNISGFVNRYDDIKGMQRVIEEKTGLSQVAVMFFQLLRSEPLKPAEGE